MSDFIKLQTESILKVPFSRYEKDFTFIVNGKKYQTSQFVADLLSSTICQARNDDPTLQEFYINTKSKGDFQQILNLVNFRTQEITVSNFAYIYEIFNQLGTQNVFIKYSDDEITLDNVIDRIKEHENISFLSDIYSKEIDFLSSHFSKILKRKREELLTLSNESLSNIMRNSKLILSTEDELISFINELYNEDRSNSNLYEFVLFKNVTRSMMQDFINIFDMTNLTCGTWKLISARLVTEIKNDDEQCHERYKQEKRSITFSHSNEEFKGIINYLKQNSNIKDEIDITYSSDNVKGRRDHAFELIDYKNKLKSFCTCDNENSWICIEFKNHLLIPSSYTIRSNSYGKSHYQLISWIVEGSSNNKEWFTLSEEKNNSILDETSVVHTFPIQNQPEHEIKFIRLRQTGPNSGRDNSLYISAIEIYGELISYDK